MGGMLSGLLGVGGGIIFIPVFEWIFRQKGLDGEELVRMMLANSFLAILFSGITSSYKHQKMGTFYPKEIITIAIPAMVFGAGMSYFITSLSWYKDVYFQLVFVIVIVVTLWRLSVSGKKEAQPELPYSRVKYGFIGVATGLISAFSGLGGGVAMIPLLTLVLRQDMRKAAGISIGVIHYNDFTHVGGLCKSNTYDVLYWFRWVFAILNRTAGCHRNIYWLSTRRCHC